jgi:hypothetical protein
LKADRIRVQTWEEVATAAATRNAYAGSTESTWARSPTSGWVSNLMPIFTVAPSSVENPYTRKSPTRSKTPNTSGW